MTAYEKWTAQLLLNTPVLSYPDFSLSSEIFWLDTDASQRLGIGYCVLPQVQPDGTDRVVARGSRSLDERESAECLF